MTVKICIFCNKILSEYDISHRWHCCESCYGTRGGLNQCFSCNDAGCRNQKNPEIYEDPLGW